MSKQHPANLPWLDRLRMNVPRYGGYDLRGNRRSAAFALRDVLSQRLSAVRTQIDDAIAACERKSLHSEVQALERAGHYVDRLIGRVGGLGTRISDFYGGPDLDAHKLDPVYAADHAVLELVDALSRRFDQPDTSHDLLAVLTSDLKELENKLDERAILLRGVN